MKLEKCALCGESPEELNGFVGCRAAYYGCPMVGVWRGLSADEWNRLQRAIRKLRKAAPAGRVLLLRGWIGAGNTASVARFLVDEPSPGAAAGLYLSARRSDKRRLRIEVHEVKGGGA